jgi:hypothetical protein
MPRERRCPPKTKPVKDTSNLYWRDSKRLAFVVTGNQ